MTPRPKTKTAAPRRDVFDADSIDFAVMSAFDAMKANDARFIGARLSTRLTSDADNDRVLRVTVMMPDNAQVQDERDIARSVTKAIVGIGIGYGQATNVIVITEVSWG